MRMLHLQVATVHDSKGRLRAEAHDLGTLWPRGSVDLAKRIVNLYLDGGEMGSPYKWPYRWLTGVISPLYS